MKLRLLVLNSHDFYPSDALLTGRSLYTETDCGSGFTTGARSFRVSREGKPLFKNADAVTPFSSGLQYHTEAIAGNNIKIHYVSSLNL